MSRHTIETGNDRSLSEIKLLLEKSGDTIERIVHRDRAQLYVETERNDFRLWLCKELSKRCKWFRLAWDTVWVDACQLYVPSLLIKDVAEMKRTHSTKSISEYFYRFMYREFTIAHYNRFGWIETYPTLWDVKNRAIGRGGTVARLLRMQPEVKPVMEKLLGKGAVDWIIEQY